MAKKRANGEGAIRQRKNGSWEGIYTNGKDENGKPIRKSIYGKTKKEVAEKLQKTMLEIRNGTLIPSSKITVAEWCDEWLKNRLLNARDSTKYQYEQYIRLYIKPELGSEKLQKVTPVMIQNLISNKYESGKGLSAKTCRNLHGIIHHLFQDAVKMDMIPKNPAEFTDLPHVTKTEMMILDGDNLKKFLEEIKGKPFEYLFYVDAFCGMREGEILGLSWDCVDFENNTIYVKQQLKRDSRIGEKNSDYILAETKTGNKRLLSPAPSVFLALKKVKAEQAENKMKYGSCFDNPDNLVFTNEIGHWINARTLLKAFKKRVDAIGLPEMRFHDLRHTYASLALQNGDDLKTVSTLLGHTNIATTANIYSHLTEKMRSDSAARMEKFIQAL